MNLTGRKQLTPLRHQQVRCHRRTGGSWAPERRAARGAGVSLRQRVRLPSTAPSAQLGIQLGDTAAGSPAQPEGNLFVTNKQTNKQANTVFCSSIPTPPATLSAPSSRTALLGLGARRPSKGGTAAPGSWDDRLLLGSDPACLLGHTRPTGAFSRGPWNENYSVTPSPSARGSDFLLPERGERAAAVGPWPAWREGPGAAGSPRAFAEHGGSEGDQLL